MTEDERMRRDGASRHQKNGQAALAGAEGSGGEGDIFPSAQDENWVGVGFLPSLPGRLVIKPV